MTCIQPHLHMWIWVNQTLHLRPNTGLGCTGTMVTEHHSILLSDLHWLIDWLIEHGLMSAPTQYRLYGRRFHLTFISIILLQYLKSWNKTLHTGRSLTNWRNFPSISHLTLAIKVFWSKQLGTTRLFSNPPAVYQVVKYLTYNANLLPLGVSQICAKHKYWLVNCQNGQLMVSKHSCVS